MTNRRVSTTLLERRGHRVLVARDGREALDVLAREAVDLVLMDLQMPVMGGLAATRAIRERETPGVHLPIIAMTAHALKGDRERCLAAGMDEYIAKPIDGKRLLALVDELTGGPTMVAGVPVPRREASQAHVPPARAEGIPGPGMPPQDAGDFAGLVARIGGDVDLAREMGTLSSTYVALLTAHDDRADVMTGLDHGADEYLTKPVDWQLLQARLRVAVRIATLQQSLARRVAELQEALANVKELQGLLPICSYCKRIRDDSNYWQQLESYVSAHTNAHFSHGVCPPCLDRLTLEL